MSEHDEQANLITWAAMHEHEHPGLEMLFAIPNGGHRHIRVAAKMKAEGVKAGVPDLFLPVPRGDYHGLFIEMKFGKNKPTAHQRHWLEMLEWHGYKTAVCYWFLDARDVLIDYLEGAPCTQ